MRGGCVRGCPPCGFSRGKGGGWRHVPQPGGIEGERADEERRTGGEEWRQPRLPPERRDEATERPKDRLARLMPPPSPLAPAKPAGGTPPHAATTHPPSPLGPAKTAGGTPPHAATTHPTSPPCRCGTWGRHANGTPTARQRHANGTPTARQRHANGTPTARQRHANGQADRRFLEGKGKWGKHPPLAPQRQ